MNLEKVLSNLSALANGVNPQTGEIIDEGIFNDPEIIRTLFHAVELIKSQPSPKKKVLPENAGKKWDVEEDEKLVNLFKETQEISLIMNEMKRTKASIISRLAKLGLIDMDKHPFVY